MNIKNNCQHCINTQYTQKDCLPLSSIARGEHVSVTGFAGCDLKTRLSNIGLGIGAEVEIITNIAGKPIIVFARGARIALSRRIASQILVEREDI